MPKYVVAIRRGHRSEGVSADQVREVPGVTIKGAANPRRVVVEARPNAIKEIMRRFGRTFRVEPENLHDRLEGW